MNNKIKEGTKLEALMDIKESAYGGLVIKKGDILEVGKIEWGTVLFKGNKYRIYIGYIDIAFKIVDESIDELKPQIILVKKNRRFTKVSTSTLHVSIDIYNRIKIKVKSKYTGVDLISMTFEKDMKLEDIFHIINNNLRELGKKEYLVLEYDIEIEDMGVGTLLDYKFRLSSGEFKEGMCKLVTILDKSIYNNIVVEYANDNGTKVAICCPKVDLKIHK